MKSQLSRSLFVALALWTCLNMTGAFAEEKAVEPLRVPIWNNKAPIDETQVETAETFLTVYRPTKPNGTAVVIFPGGGYGGLAIEPEGHGIARWLNGHDIAGVVVQYRLPAGRSQVPLLDAQRSIRTTRSHAAEWGINPSRIGVIGFSAGGHLASTAATHFDAGNPQAIDPVDRLSCRPDFAILIYPVITMGEKTHQGSKKNLLGMEPSAKSIEWFSNEKQVTDKTPPTFLAHAKDDFAVVIENSQMFYAALQKQHVAGQLLELPSGGHGLNGYKGPMWDAWQTQSLAWLASQMLIP